MQCTPARHNHAFHKALPHPCDKLSGNHETLLHPYDKLSANRETLLHPRGRLSPKGETLLHPCDKVSLKVISPFQGLTLKKVIIIGQILMLLDVETLRLDIKFRLAFNNPTLINRNKKA